MLCLYCKQDNIDLDIMDYKTSCEECSAELIECNLCSVLTHMDYLVCRPDIFGQPLNEYFIGCEVCYNCEVLFVND